MSHTPEDLAQLRASGARITPQREVVLCALHSAQGHITAEVVYEHVRRMLPDIGLATVYRNLDFLKEQGVIVATDMGNGCIMWELAQSPPHHHTVCRECGAMTQLEHAFVQGLEQKMRDQLGFQANLSHLAFFGLCARCSSDS